MNTCYINKRRRVYHGFLMPKDFIYGTIDGIDFITNGNPKTGKMLIYKHNGNGWMQTYVDVETDTIAITVLDRYSDVITEKNKQYKGSLKEYADRQEWRNKAYGQELEMRSVPYNAIYKDSKYRCIKAAIQERKMGL